MRSISIELEKGRRLVENLAGILLEQHDLSAFASAVEQGMTRTGAARPAAYFEHLRNRQGHGELERLLEQVVNNETYFFRESRHLEILRKIVPTICAARSASQEGLLRILSAGCSTGEEPYSIAIELMDLQRRFPGLDFKVVGVDISQRALARARRAVFGRNSFRNSTAAARRSTWFEPAGNCCFKLADRVASKVEFRCLNLNSNRSLKDALGTVDIVFFRNVLIYLSPAARLRVCRNLVSALRESGYLFTGISEMLPAGVEGLVSQQVDGIFFWKKGTADKSQALPREIPGRPPQRESFPPTDMDARRVADATPEPPAMTARQGRAPFQSHSHRRQEEWDAWYAEALRMVRKDRARDALELLDMVTREAPDHIDACRLTAALYLDCAEFAKALLFSGRVLEIDATLAWPHVLQGRVFQYEGDMAKAQKELKTAIYYQPDYWPAHFYLAEAYKALGERSLAVHAYRNALRNLARDQKDGELDVDLIGYSRTDIALTCRMNIRSLTESATDDCAE